jgi:hypothetical protein
VRADLAALQAWHRQNELPAYIVTLEKLQRMAPANVTSEQVCDVYAELKPRFQTLVDQAGLTLVSLAPTLTPEQLDHLARQLKKRSDKWREEWMDGSPAELGSRRVKQLQDRVEMLYGRLEEPQLAVLRSSVASSVFDAATSSRESQRRHQDALQTLRQLQRGMPDPQRIKAQVHDLLSRAIDSPDAAYRNYLDKVTQENCKTLAALHNSITPTQRTKAIETLKDYAADARALMAQKP